MNFTPKNTANDKGTTIKTYPSVTRYMATNLITFRPEQPVSEVIDIFLEKKISGAPVLNENQELVGIISEKDCLRVMIGSAYHNQPISMGKFYDTKCTNDFRRPRCFRCSTSLFEYAYSSFSCSE